MQNTEKDSEEEKKISGKFSATYYSQPLFVGVILSEKVLELYYHLQERSTRHNTRLRPGLPQAWTHHIIMSPIESKWWVRICYQISV